MKNILITGGPTNEFIDEVMKITNMSTGSTSLLLAANLCQHPDYHVTLIGNHLLPRLAQYEQQNLHCATNFTFVGTETTADMFEALTAASQNTYDLVIHPAAVGDYKPEFSFTMEHMAKELAATIKAANAQTDLEELIFQTLTHPKNITDDSSKISSYEQNLTVKLTLTTKLIAQLKNWFPNAIKIGFKLLNQVTQEELFQVAQKLCLKNEMDYILANDLSIKNQGLAILHVIDQNGYTKRDLHGDKDLYHFVLECLNQ